MKKLLKISIYLICIFGLSTLAGCSSLNIFKTKKPQEVQSSTSTDAAQAGSAAKALTVQVSAQTNVNPNENGKASPIVVILFQLKDNANFNLLDFFSLYRQPAASLGADFVEQQQVIMRPGEKKTLNLTLDNSTQYLGVLAAYRQVEQTQWRASLKISGVSAKEAVIQLGRDAVNIRGE